MDSDFNGDGKPDLAIADPDATVDGQVRAGHVTVAYGGGGTQVIDQRETPGNDNGAGDRFGFALDSVDWNDDGCSDLFVGAPFELWNNNTISEAGMVAMIPGSPSGLDVAKTELIHQGKSAVPGGAEEGDRFGYSIAAGVDERDNPFVLIGAPGESIGAVERAGMVVYGRPGGEFASIHQGHDNVVGGAEVNDMYGYSLAASARGFVIGAPGEAIGPSEYAGVAHVFKHPADLSVGTVWGDLQQDTPGISGVAEAGDMMGFSVDMVDYKTSSGDFSSIVVVGNPGEDGGYKDQGGVYEFTADGSIVEKENFGQGSSGIPGAREDGDLFGAGLAAINRKPGSVPAWSDLLLAVGVPGEDVTSDDGAEHVDRGWVQTVSLLTSPDDHISSIDKSLVESDAMTWHSGSRIGDVLHATATHLFFTDFSDAAPAVYGIPWDNLYAGETETVIVYKPGEDGIPADSVNFGAALA
ncbi:hypothetical protein [Salininema proteolyticum]|uniref:FG-GAP repeat protein n=1 Tax=Salininema proteolyticum TaxID=1607685 RepID=A0ABV8U4P3_9ACTN